MRIIDSYYVAKFATDANKKLSLRIGRAKPNVELNAAKTALQNIVTANALNPEYGNLTGAISLAYVTVTRTPFNVGV